jgi:Phosphoesterase family/Immunoglobulin domain/Immunoglobulin I-set domain
MMNRVGVVSLCLLCAIAFVNAGCNGTVAGNNPPPVMPSIATQPANQTVTAGQTATFMVVAMGTAPLSYQWQKDGTAVGGATSASYTTAATSSSDNGAKFQVVVSNSAGTVTSNAATLTVNAAAAAPSITTQPVNQTVTAGQTATFMVVATGTAPLAYQWQKNGTAISGATSASYTTPATTSSDNAAQFVVVVSNSAGSVTSNAATLTVNAGAVAPTITTQPANQTVTVGQTASFTVVATGTAPLAYQWQKNSTAISGATSASYATPATTSADNGAKFVVVVSNSAGSVTSNAATLTVNASATAPTITTQPANQTVTVGQTATFTVAATGTAPLSYQWQKNGTAISGATSASYTTPATTSADNGAKFVVVVSNVAGNVTSNAATLTVNAAGSGAIKTVFLILEENHNWSQIKGSTSAPYINNTLLANGAHAEQYYNPPGIHPSEPNYLWLEAGTNFGITNDNDPSSNHQSTTNHLVTFLKNANISWKSYQEDISGTTCPLTGVNSYAPKHNPFVFFDDVTNTNDPASAYCIAHVRPYTELATDLTNNTVASYNFITPNLCDDGHDSCSPLSDPVAQTDTWLSQNLPAIINSTAYKAGGVAIFITWDEGEGGDGPIGMIVLSPNAKVGYQNSIHYDHSSTLRTMEEIFHVTPLLGGAASATDLSDLFVSFP